MRRPRINPIYGYIFLKVHYDANRSTNPLHLLLPILRHGIKRLQTGELSTHSLQEQITETWGVKIPQHVLRFLLPRIDDKKTIQFDEAEKKWIVKNDSLLVEDLKKQEKIARETYERVISRVRIEALRARF